MEPALVAQMYAVLSSVAMERVMTVVGVAARTMAVVEVVALAVHSPSVTMNTLRCVVLRLVRIGGLFRHCL